MRWGNFQTDGYKKKQKNLHATVGALGSFVQKITSNLCVFKNEEGSGQFISCKGF